MENQHLTYFKVENFKKFDSLEVKDIGQFNLIVGDNNVGKTCLLEALLVDEDSNICIKNLHKSLCLRELHIHGEIRPTLAEKPFELNLPEENYLEFLLKDINKKLQIELQTKNKKNVIAIQYKEYNQLEKIDFENLKKQNLNPIQYKHYLSFFLNDSLKSTEWLYKDNFSNIHNYKIPFIKLRDLYKNDLVSLFGEVDRDTLKKEKLIQISKIVIPKLKDITIGLINNTPYLMITLDDVYNKIPLTNFGDGIIKLIRFTLEIMFLKNNRIMIDEIDAGIHHSKLKDFWSNIIKLCEELKIQLFATTHSKECEIAFAEALKKIKEEKNGRLISLQEEKNGIQAYVYPIQNLDFDYEYRG